MTDRSSLRNVLCLALAVGMKLCLEGVFVLTFQLEGLMMRSFVKVYCGLCAAALIGLPATIALAGDLGLVQNGDMELESRFVPHGTPGVETVNGVPDGWGHSQNTGWSNGTTDPHSSGIHSMKLADQSVSSMEEGRSFVNSLPRTSVAGDVMQFHWNWYNTITSNVTGTGDQFSATIRVSQVTAANSNCCDLQTNVIAATVLTSGTPTGSLEQVSLSVPIPAGINTFDIIFNTGNRLLNDVDHGKLDVTGTMFVDDVSGNLVPEPATMGLLGLGGLGLMMMVSRRRSS
jgi:hypothetical protein